MGWIAIVWRFSGSQPDGKNEMDIVSKDTALFDHLPHLSNELSQGNYMFTETWVRGVSESTLQPENRGPPPKTVC